jgi:predicted regulator of Ras-like GTPase activity (Roadblock/LC7/MglB family)
VKRLVNEAYALALKDALDGIVHSSPGIRNALIFDESGDIVAVNNETSEDKAVRTVDALDKLLENADLFGNLENVVFEGAEGLLNVSHFDDLFLVTVASARTDLDRTNVFANLLIPTVLKVLRRVNLAPAKENPEEPEIEREELLTHEENEKPEPIENGMAENPEKSAPRTSSEDIQPEPLANQFIVENLGGLFASSDTARIDNATLLNWNDMYDDRKIEEIEIVTFGGKSVRCKVKPIKDAKCEGKGLVQIHEKVQSTLEIKKGELVRVKPVIE